MEVNDAVEAFMDERLKLSPQDTEALLHDLCVELGYCVGPEETDAIVADPPTDPGAFAKLVMRVDGVESDDPVMYTPVLMRALTVFTRAASRIERGASLAKA